MGRSNTDHRVVTGPAGLDVEGALPAQQLRNAWTPMSETSPQYRRDQFVAWLQILGEREGDKAFSEAAEADAKIFYEQEYLSNGKKWARYFRYFQQQNADATRMSRLNTPSNISSAIMQHIEGLLQEPLTAQTHRSWTEHMKVMNRLWGDL
jgi:hypothetical protein